MTNPIKIVSKKEYSKENKEPNQEEVWDSIASPWKEYRTKEIPVVAEFLKDKEGKVIDLGCGSGRNMIKNDDIEYYGVDFSGEQLKQAWDYIQKEGINAKLFKSKADELNKEDFPDDFFNYGLFIATLHCIESKKKRENAVRGFYRVLKKGSEAIISVWNSEDERFLGLKGDTYMSWKENNISYMRYYYLYDKNELVDLFKKIGFKILEIYDTREHDRFSKKNWIIRVKK